MKTIAKINEVPIVMIEDGESLVPIKPICQAIGVSHQKQIEKLKNDDILSSATTLGVTVAADGKERNMTCLPYKYIFGWLFTINPKNVKPEAKEAVTKYKLACYDALYNYFTEQSDFANQKQDAMVEQQEKIDKVRAEFNQAKNKLKATQDAMKTITGVTFEQWKINDMQMSMFTEDEQQG